MNTQHGRKHSIRWLALELNVDRLTLTRRLAATGKDTTEKFTVAEAHAAWTLKAQRESDRDRKIRAEAENAEATAAQRKGKIKEVLTLSMRDVMLKVRSIHEGLDLPMAMRKRVCKEIQDIEMIIPQI